ncbi:MAG: BrnT family toxin [Chloroflexi bacterium]|nr:BrnT family toxin [Chloroflexota bacterium]
MPLFIADFDWDAENEDKIWDLHRVTRDEIEEVFDQHPLVRKARERKYYAFGQTTEGRYLFIVFVWRPNRVIRVITARDMDESERFGFRKSKRG